MNLKKTMRGLAAILVTTAFIFAGCSNDLQVLGTQDLKLSGNVKIQSTTFEADSGDLVFTENGDFTGSRDVTLDGAFRGKITDGKLNITLPAGVSSLTTDWNDETIPVELFGGYPAITTLTVNPIVNANGSITTGNEGGTLEKTRRTGTRERVIDESVVYVYSNGPSTIDSPSSDKVIRLQDGWNAIYTRTEYTLRSLSSKAEFPNGYLPVTTYSIGDPLDWVFTPDGTGSGGSQYVSLMIDGISASFAKDGDTVTVALRDTAGNTLNTDSVTVSGGSLTGAVLFNVGDYDGQYVVRIINDNDGFYRSTNFETFTAGSVPVTATVAWARFNNNTPTLTAPTLVSLTVRGEGDTPTTATDDEIEVLLTSPVSGATGYVIYYYVDGSGSEWNPQAVSPAITDNTGLSTAQAFTPSAGTLSTDSYIVGVAAVFNNGRSDITWYGTPVQPVQ